MTRRTLIVIVAAIAALAPGMSSADEVTTFSFESAGCSGGGNACGTFPLVPMGDAEYEHTASSDGVIEVAASADRGLPLEVCLPGRQCEPLFRYHAEALGRVWTTVSTPAGAAYVTIDADYDLVELTAEATSLGGSPEAAIDGVLSIVPAAGFTSTTCTNGNAIVGAETLSIDASTPTGAGTLGATFECEDGGLMPPMTWRVQLAITSAATSDGGEAAAEAVAQMTKVATAVALP